eukprot:gene13445-19303_t
MGLQQHMVACHEHFLYTFVPAGAKHGSMVLVRVKESIYTDDNRLIPSDSERVVDPETGLQYRSIWYYCRKTNPLRVIPLNASPVDVPLGEMMPLNEMGHLLASSIQQSDYIRPSVSGRGRSGGLVRKRGGASGGRQGASRTGSGGLSAGVRGLMLNQDRVYFHAKTSMRMTDCAHFHAKTSMRMTTKEAAEAQDSDDDTDTEELQKKIKRDLHDNSNLNVAERKFMRLWNQFQRKGAAFADFITPARCLQFVEVNLEALSSEPEMRRCLVMHLLMLWDFALMDGAYMNRCLALVDGQASSGGALEPPSKPASGGVAMTS